jgi:methionine-rich copper-binding protein CopC
MKKFLWWMVAALLLIPEASLAHAHLVRSTPAENAVLEKAPATAALVFAEPVTMTAITIELIGGAKTNLKPLPASATADPSVPLPTLAPGHYKLSWRAVSDDGHIMSGQIHFSVGGASGH